MKHLECTNRRVIAKVGNYDTHGLFRLSDSLCLELKERQVRNANESEYFCRPTPCFMGVRGTTLERMD